MDGESPKLSVSAAAEFIGLVEFLQIAELNRRNYCISLSRPGEQGVIIVVDGALCHAAIGDWVGPPAAERLVEWSDADIEVNLQSAEAPLTIPDGGRLIPSLALKTAERWRGSPPNPAWRMGGDLGLISPVELLQLFELNQRPVQLRCISEKGAITVFLENGRVVHAVFAPAGGTVEPKRSPEEVVYDLVTWKGRFEAAVCLEFPARTLDASVNSLVLEGMRLAEERARLEREQIAEAQALGEKTLQDLMEGKASDGVRRLVAKRYLARGRTAPMQALLKLAQDPDARVRLQALESIGQQPLIMLRTIAGDPQTPDTVLRHLVQEFWDEDEIMRPLAQNPSASEETLGLLASFASDAVLAIIMKDAERLARSQAIQEGIKNRGDRASKLRRKQQLDAKKRAGGSLHKRIMDLSLPDKIFLAYRGSAAERAILAQHPMHMVATAVLLSPKITDGEVENLASMKSVNADVLLGIANTPVWINQYPIARAVAMNPKTPPHISIDLMKRMREADLRQIQRDRNLPEPVRASAARRLQIIEKKKAM